MGKSRQFHSKFWLPQASILPASWRSIPKLVSIWDMLLLSQHNVNVATQFLDQK